MLSESSTLATIASAGIIIKVFDGHVTPLSVALSLLVGLLIIIATKKL